MINSGDQLLRMKLKTIYIGYFIRISASDRLAHLPEVVAIRNQRLQMPLYIRTTLFIKTVIRIRSINSWFSKRQIIILFRSLKLHYYSPFNELQQHSPTLPAVASSDDCSQLVKSQDMTFLYWPMHTELIQDSCDYK